MLFSLAAFSWGGGTCFWKSAPSVLFMCNDGRERHKGDDVWSPQRVSRGRGAPRRNSSVLAGCFSPNRCAAPLKSESPREEYRAVNAVVRKKKKVYFRFILYRFAHIHLRAVCNYCTLKKYKYDSMIMLIWNAHVELVCFHTIKIISCYAARCYIRVTRSPGPIPAVMEWRRGFTRSKLPLKDTNNLPKSGRPPRLLCSSLDCEKKREYVERTHCRHAYGLKPMTCWCEATRLSTTVHSWSVRCYFVFTTELKLLDNKGQTDARHQQLNHNALLRQSF